jgi:2-polyprenyl-6-methoxyphenol hydroxylase-like FAD-dependent oxidoreductase
MMSNRAIIFDNTTTAQSFKTDIVVIGGGGPGLTAAIAAAEAGVKNITVLEKTRTRAGMRVYVTVFSPSAVRYRNGRALTLRRMSLSGFHRHREGKDKSPTHSQLYQQITGYFAMAGN